jgi:UDP-glucose 6-dehydrogenase
LYNTVDSAAHSKYNNIIKAIACDPRIGRGHTFVPGYDGKKGFGGACLPKDIRAFYHAHPEFSLLNTIDQLNNEMRSQYDLDDREKVNKIKFNRNGDANVDNGQTEKE